MNSWKTLGSAVSASEASPERARRPRGLVGEIIEILAANIRAGLMRSGDKLPTEAEIMTRFNVSRSVVRESMSKLQVSGLVKTRHGIGTFVLLPEESGNFKIAADDFATIADVISELELRIGLETEAAGLAAQRRTAENLLALETALHAFRESILRDSDAVPPDFQFHMEIARSTGNRDFADLMNYLGIMIIPRTRVNTAHSAPEGRLNYLQRVNTEHESIYNAIRDQDADADPSGQQPRTPAPWQQCPYPAAVWRHERNSLQAHELNSRHTQAYVVRKPSESGRSCRRS